MPTTETPISPPERPSEPAFRRKRSQYEELEPHEVFHLIEELQDERSRARLRESIWISIILNMIVCWFLFYGPRYILHQPHVVNPADVLKNRKDLTYLDLPPEALQKIKPKAPKTPSDQNRAESRQPTLDRKTLEQLQAMRKAAPPEPAPEQAQNTPSVPQVAQQKPSQPLPPSPQAQIEAPAPRPNLNTGSQSPSEAIRDAARAAIRPRGPFAGEGGEGASPEHSGLGGGAEVLSDTLGVDFNPYMRQVIRATYRSWDPLIPESVRPPLLKQGKVRIRFKILPDGSVKEMILEGPSGDVSLDRAAWGAIVNAGYPQLPREFKGPFLELRFYFLYNTRQGAE